MLKWKRRGVLDCTGQGRVPALWGCALQAGSQRTGRRSEGEGSSTELTDLICAGPTGHHQRGRHRLSGTETRLLDEPRGASARFPSPLAAPDPLPRLSVSPSSTQLSHARPSRGTSRADSRRCTARPPQHCATPACSTPRARLPRRASRRAHTSLNGSVPEQRFGARSRRGGWAGRSARSCMAAGPRSEGQAAPRRDVERARACGTTRVKESWMRCVRTASRYVDSGRGWPGR